MIYEIELKENSVHAPTVYLNGNGTLGAHGGSGLSSIGGMLEGRREGVEGE